MSANINEPAAWHESCMSIARRVMDYLVIASVAKQSSSLIGSVCWIALKDADLLRAEARAESYAALRSQ